MVSTLSRSPAHTHMHTLCFESVEKTLLPVKGVVNAGEILPSSHYRVGPGSYLPLKTPQHLIKLLGS